MWEREVDKITNVFASNQKSKKILLNLTNILFNKPDLPHLKIHLDDYEALIKTFPVREQELMRKMAGMKLLGVPIYPIS